jgi:hypothetical protein
VIIELAHPTDPRYLLVDDLPERVTMEALASGAYGKPLLAAPGPAIVYEQPGGFGTPWERP